MKTTLNALAVLLGSVLVGVNPVRAQGVLGQMLRNNQGGRLSAGLAAGTGQYTATFPAVSGTVVMNEAGIVNLRTSSFATEQRFFNTAGTFYTGLRAGAATANTTFTLPTADGAAGQLLSTNGSGQLQWVTPAAGGGSNWMLSGNAGTNASTQFLGTTDNVGMSFRTNNTERMVINNLGKIGVGMAATANTLSVLDNIEIYRNPSTSFSSLLFTNTSGSGDFRIAGDGGDIFWQGGGGRNLQMGSYHGMILAGDRQTATLLPFAVPTAATTNTNVLIQGQRTTSVPLAIQGATGITANLTEWRAPGTNAIMNVVNANGNLGLGNGAPAEKLDVTGNLRFTGALMPGGTAGAAGQVLISGGPNAAPTWLSVSSVNVWLPGGNTLSSQQNFGTISNHNLPFITNGTERMRLTTTGRLGIGTTAPAEVLDVNGNIRFNNALMPAGAAGTAGQILQSNGAGNAPTWVTNAPNTWITSGNNNTSAAILGTLDNNPLRFVVGADASAERMRITNTGNVGINTTTPAEVLDVNGNIRLSGVGRQLVFATPGGDPDGVIKMRRHAVSTEGSEMLFYSGNDIPGTYGPDRIRMVSNEFRIQTFNTDVNTLVEAEAENNTNTRLFINSAGNVGLGTVNPNTGFRLHVVGDVLASDYYRTSDKRLKSDINNLPYGLSQILGLKPVSYKYKDNSDEKTRLGFIAQDVKAFIPEAVVKDKDSDLLRMSYLDIIPVLVNAIKEQQSQIDDLKKEISNLKKNQK